MRQSVDAAGAARPALDRREPVGPRRVMRDYCRLRYGALINEPWMRGWKVAAANAGTSSIT